MPEQTKNEKLIWALFMNSPSEECLTLLEQAHRILIARNVIKAKRQYTKKEKANA
jgi:hypothetical protein